MFAVRGSSAATECEVAAHSPVEDDGSAGNPGEEGNAIDAGHARMFAEDMAASCCKEPHNDEGYNAVPVVGHIVVDG